MGKETTLISTKIAGVEIPVIYERSALIPAGKVRLIFQGAGNVQDGALIGRSALLEELLNRGSKSRGNVGFAEALEREAISLDVSSGLQTLSFGLDFLSEARDSALVLLGELVKDPNFTAAELKKAKTAIIARILANQNDYDYRAEELLDSVLFAGTPLAQSKLGSKEDIERLSLKDIKQAYADALQLKRLIIIIGGDVELEEITRALDSMLSHLPHGQPYEKPTFQVRENPESKSDYAPTQQAYIYFGSPLYVGDLAKERYLARVAAFILGSGGFGSRILEEVRVKRGLAYGAYIRFYPSTYTSYTSGYLQTKLESQDEAIAVVKQTIAGFVKNGATQAELDAAKKFLLGSEPLGSETLSQRLTRAFSDYYVGLGVGFSQKELDQIRTLDLATLNAYIKAHSEIEKLSFGIITAPESSPKTKNQSKK